MDEYTPTPQQPETQQTPEIPEAAQPAATPDQLPAQPEAAYPPAAEAPAAETLVQPEAVPAEAPEAVQPAPAQQPEKAAKKSVYTVYYGPVQPAPAPVPAAPAAEAAAQVPGAQTAPVAEQVPPVAAPQPPKRKKSRKGWKVTGAIALLLVCFMVGSIFGVGVLHPLLNQNNDGAFGEFFGDWESQFSETGEVYVMEDDYPANPDISALGGAAPTISNLANPVPEIAAQVSQGVVGVYGYMQGEEGEELYSRGTGFVAHADGYIITNYHVVVGCSGFNVLLWDGSAELEARYVGGDPKTDIAVLKIDNSIGLPALAIADYSTVRAGDMAIALGDPEGMDLNLAGSVTVGYVSNPVRPFEYREYTQDFLQMDTPVNAGNSGGPLVNERGELIGVVTLKSLVSSYDALGQPVTSEGLGFAVPADRAVEVALQIIRGGTICRPGIGITYIELDAESAAEQKLPRGKQIQEFMVNSPAQEAGMEIGDVILECNGVSLAEEDILVETISMSAPGDIVTLTVWREGEMMDFPVLIGDVNQMIPY